MSEKRKDSKGRILRTGESQRTDGRYQYRYKDVYGERRSIYDWDLHSLRAKEKEIQKQISEGVSYFDGNIPLGSLIDKAFTLKRKLDGFNEGNDDPLFANCKDIKNILFAY